MDPHRYSFSELISCITSLHKYFTVLRSKPTSVSLCLPNCFGSYMCILDMSSPLKLQKPSLKYMSLVFKSQFWSTSQVTDVSLCFLVLSCFSDHLTQQSFVQLQTPEHRCLFSLFGASLPCTREPGVSSRYTPTTSHLQFPLKLLIKLSFFLFVCFFVTIQIMQLEYEGFLYVHKQDPNGMILCPLRSPPVFTLLRRYIYYK